MPRRPEDKREAVLIAKTIGTAVRAVRQRRELTLDALSEQIGITSEALGRIERGSALPSFPTFVRIGKILDVEPGALLDSGDEADAPVKPLAKPSTATRLEQVATRLSTSSQRAVLVVAHQLLQLERRGSRRDRRSR